MAFMKLKMKGVFIMDNDLGGTSRESSLFQRGDERQISLLYVI
jgi:hypothetical protein